jgi:hypothetical protein
MFSGYSATFGEMFIGGNDIRTTGIPEDCVVFEDLSEAVMIISTFLSIN